MTEQTPPTSEQPTVEEPTGEEPTGEERTSDPRRLTRDTNNQYIGGVSSGVAEYFGIDATVVRIGFVIAAFFGGLGLFAYLAGWILIPEQTAPSDEDMADRFRQNWPWIALVFLGFLLVGGFGDFDGQNGPFGFFVGLALLGGGAFLLLSQKNRRDGEPRSDWEKSVDDAFDKARVSVNDSLERNRDREARRKEKAAQRRNESTLLGALGAGAMLLAAAIMAVIDQSDRYDIPFRNMVAVELFVVGAILLIGTVFGRARGFLWWLPLLIVIGLIGGEGKGASAGFGNEDWTPETLAQVQEKYELGAGQGILDLRGIDVPDGEQVNIELNAGAGRLVVYVPREEAFDIEASLGIGAIDVLGRTDGGPASEVTFNSGNGNEGINLEVHGGVGRIDVSYDTLEDVR